MFVRKTFWQRMGQFDEPPGCRWVSICRQRITQTKRRQFDRIHQRVCKWIIRTHNLSAEIFVSAVTYLPTYLSYYMLYIVYNNVSSKFEMPINTSRTIRCVGRRKKGCWIGFFANLFFIVKFDVYSSFLLVESRRQSIDGLHSKE